MVTIDFVVGIVLNAVIFVSTILYIYCQCVLYSIIKRRAKEKLASYLFFFFFCGFINLGVIANMVVFQLLPSFALQPFFYGLGQGGARFTFMVNFGCEFFVITCVAFLAISRYLTFIRKKMSNNYWSLARVRLWLLGLLAVSVAYSAIFLACPFMVEWGPNKANVRFMFNDVPNWVAVSICVPFLLAVVSCISCTYCYYKVATIIRGSQTGLTNTIVARLCLASSIISFGAVLSLFVRIANHISYRVNGHDFIPLGASTILNRIGNLIAVCGDPWILLALFPVVREEAFPCVRKRTASTFTVFTTVPSSSSK